MKIWMLFLPLLLTQMALAEANYYVNPDGGRYYHQRPDCPSISQKYHAGMQSLTLEQLTETYTSLKPCQVCGAEIPEAQEEKRLTDGTFVIGVDAPQGLYQLEGGSRGTAEVYEWDGTVAKSVSADQSWSEVVRLRNEQTLVLTNGTTARFMLEVNVSPLDTGSRQLVIRDAGNYSVGETFDPGLYIVENQAETSETLRIKRNSETMDLFLRPGAYYTFYMSSGMELELPVGCLLRSFSGRMMFQEEPVRVVQGQYLLGQQMPGGVYTMKGVSANAMCRVTDEFGAERTSIQLAEGEEAVLDLSKYGESTLVEIIDCVVTFHMGENG